MLKQKKPLKQLHNNKSYNYVNVAMSITSQYQKAKEYNLRTSKDTNHKKTNGKKSIPKE
jgi:hypothetical protein